MRAIITYISRINPQSAKDLQDRIEACTDRIVSHPFLYRPGRRANTREAVVHPNYIVVYRVGTDAVEIVNVLHSRRQYPPAGEA